ncbi:tyrosine-type recombinase/integrase [Serratia fonticola]|uniref:tyrosine-type recombinase/integrase n=1 Tax=Serratia fonticola TaxID=47917 RepID=UPI001376DEC4|nr:tyrosine-type recombinase/integrase [Serratia fonticola]
MKSPGFHVGRQDSISIKDAADLPFPHYLLAPEVAVLLSYLPDMLQRLLIDTLWNTGIRINEALALTQTIFFNDMMPFVRLRTLKQRTIKKPVRCPTKEASSVVPQLVVSLPDVAYQRRVQEYFSTFKLMALL